MSGPEYPVTTAVRFLHDRNIAFRPHVYRFEEHGGTAHAARELGVPEHAVVKTLVMESEAGDPVLVLMHGDREVSTKQLARILGVKRMSACDVNTAQKLTGYLVGGISPFGTRSTLPVHVERTILDLSCIYINGGKRGFLVSMNPSDLRRAFEIREVETGIVDIAQ